jgi:hypothetical protein
MGGVEPCDDVALAEIGSGSVVLLFQVLLWVVEILGKVLADDSAIARRLRISSSFD